MRIDCPVCAETADAGGLLNEALESGAVKEGAVIFHWKCMNSFVVVSDGLRLLAFDEPIERLTSGEVRLVKDNG